MLESVIDSVAFNADGLVAAIIQSADTDRVLMLGWMNPQSLAMTIESGETVFWSRSRQELWHKGETSGNTQKVVSIELDCDADALLIRVHEAGPACHTGTESCFDSHTILERE
ncbi:MAG: phosphoribosyl-AMP cyclohydrolase [Micrococcales bacterium]